ncbi:polyprenyl synthetase family protein [Candidatus Micrarchaeota archaeon]|nr:polyprenyl synthetase family protein [Candidatus Micrarchaeota archaeon]
MVSYRHIRPYLSEVERAMRTQLRREDERTYGMLPSFLSRGGKRIRPALTMLCCGAVGGYYTDAVEPSAILELFHNFTLVHDDIEDGAEFRRGEPALHVAHGIPIALNSGDALYTLLWKDLVNLNMEPSRLVKLQKLYAESFKRVVEGQGIELYWIKEGKFDISEKEYYEMIEGKTSALTGLSCELGAFLGNADKDLKKSLREYGELLGTAFQIQDDVLNVTGDFKTYKKEIGGDIREGKRTIMVVHCLKNASKADKKKLVSTLSSDTKTKDDIQAVIELFRKHGSIEHAQAKARLLAEEAKEHLEGLSPSKDKDTLLELGDYVVSRKS